MIKTFTNYCLPINEENTWHLKINIYLDLVNNGLLHIKAYQLLNGSKLRANHLAILHLLNTLKLLSRTNISIHY